MSKAPFVCDRCGWRYEHSSRQREPGTNHLVCPSCNDGKFSLVSHPQNFSRLRGREEVVRDVRPDVSLGV